jgi:hypothetical protein
MANNATGLEVGVGLVDIAATELAADSEHGGGGGGGGGLPAQVAARNASVAATEMSCMLQR